MVNQDETFYKVSREVVLIKQISISYFFYNVTDHNIVELFMEPPLDEESKAIIVKLMS